MTGIDSYSTTPATNATCDAGAINYAEGMPPSAVNNSARQALADTRSAFNDLVWFQYSTGNQGAGNIAVPAVYASSTSFTIAGADVTAAYHVGRRVRAVGSGTGTIYGTISVTSYAPTTTTVTVVWDSGSLSNETLVISLSQIPVTGHPVPTPYGSWTPSITINAVTTGITYSRQNGLYLKIGNLVVLWYDILLSSKGAQTGNVAFTGLPYTVLNTGGFANVFGIGYPSGSGVPATSSLQVSAGTTTGTVNIIGGAQLTDANLTNTSSLGGMLVYIAA